ncbi:MAG TPA: hypothetical protein HPP80_04290 [Rhodospirillaceae bacterium]|nr:hypothetical protein [Rhodospirillaceae bacterium]
MHDFARQEADRRHALQLQRNLLLLEDLRRDLEAAQLSDIAMTVEQAISSIESLLAQRMNADDQPQIPFY